MENEYNLIPLSMNIKKIHTRVYSSEAERERRQDKKNTHLKLLVPKCQSQSPPTPEVFSLQVSLWVAGTQLLEHHYNLPGSTLANAGVRSHNQQTIPYCCNVRSRHHNNQARYLLLHSSEAPSYSYIKD